jgi:hypothetical protein
MSEIRLEDAKINFQGQWLSAEELTGMIREKLDAGDLKFAEPAAALEALATAMDNSHTLEERVVVPKETYERLIERGGDDENTSVHKAVMEYIEPEGAASVEDGSADESADESADGNSVIKCTRCKALIEVPSDQRPIVFDCPICGTSCRLTL